MSGRAEPSSTSRLAACAALTLAVAAAAVWPVADRAGALPRTRWHNPLYNQQTASAFLRCVLTSSRSMRPGWRCGVGKGVGNRGTKRRV